LLMAIWWRYIHIKFGQAETILQTWISSDLIKTIKLWSIGTLCSRFQKHLPITIQCIKEKTHIN
jgi:hypothetical protein